VAGWWNRLVGSREYIRVNINKQTFNFIPHYRSITPDHGVLRGARKLLTSKKEIAIVLAVHPQQLKNFGETMQSLQAEI
jgi:hypothetical protein